MLLRVKKLPVDTLKYSDSRTSATNSPPPCADASRCSELREFLSRGTPPPSHDCLSGPAFMRLPPQRVPTPMRRSLPTVFTRCR